MSELYVVFKVEDCEYVLQASDVLQMESFAGATKVPGTPPYVAGLIHIRGRVVPVVDLRLRFGLPRIEPTMDSRVIVVQSGERTVGLLVDSAREIMKIAPEGLQAPPSWMGGESSGFVKSVAHVERRPGEKRLVMLVNFPKIIGQEGIYVDERNG
ncbi:chemotaxis protein CheW [Polyangium jinanense]|uniref:Purine-binding chemotaxis protein CheW n=1 Tax=Polyangium jinanense TaxID=2829994 RepID=A0A9X3WYJ2_9BACT|nr:chemotaxis protein CheW [Polyangium jinanense]MDC3960357.1 purine-binding chemotaxis protein CheW [Polyangium jinanense]MDC3978978.1 purine-binding chemotaxis protein CheW [Polyangium jinanense]